LLIEIPEFYYHVEGVSVYDSDLLSFHRVCFGNDDKFNLGKYLVELDELLINTLQKHYGIFE